VLIVDGTHSQPAERKKPHQMAGLFELVFQDWSIRVV
jgi:hypothetical protein